jgi:Prokaryotic E2 family E
MELPRRDVSFLQSKGFAYELNQFGQELYLVLKGWKFQAYTPEQADVLIVISAAYPLGQLDMFWTHPFVRLKNGALPQACEYHQILNDGKEWQRWSRHINWRAGVDNLQTFIKAMTAEISKGV